MHRFAQTVTWISLIWLVSALLLLALELTSINFDGLMLAACAGLVLSVLANGLFLTGLAVALAAAAIGWAVLFLDALRLARPRLLPTCGPVAWPAICRACALELGTDAWCDGHADEAIELLSWARELPPWWGDAVVLWWVATGEVVSGPAQPHPQLPAAVAAAAP